MNILFKKMMLVAVVFPLTLSSVYAKPGGNRDGMPLRGMLEQVDLSAEQQVKVDAITQSYRAKAKPQSNKGAYHDGFMTILKAKKFDTQQAKVLIDARDALRKERNLQKMQMMFDVYHSLNSEQQAKMDLLFSQHQQKMLKRGKNRGHGYGHGKGKGCSSADTKQ